MEEEKKKRKNKKKKNKQNKAPESTSVFTEESTLVDETRSFDNVQSNQGNPSEATDVQKHILQKTDIILDRHHANGIKDVSLEERIKQLLMEKDAQIQKEVSLEETIKQFQKDEDGQIEKETSLEERIKQLQIENDMQLQKEVSLEEKIKQLHMERDAQVEKETSLEERFKQLQMENDSLLQKEVSLKEKIKQLQKEKDAQIEKEAGLEVEIKQLQEEKHAQIKKEASLEIETLKLQNEKHFWLQKELSLEEKLKQLDSERDSWVQQENSTREMILTLKCDYSKLQAQVSELEESRNSLLQENQWLAKNINDLQSQPLTSHISSESTTHAPENEDMNTEMEAAQGLIEKLITENAELVEKVNELYIELEQRAAATKLSTSVGSELMGGTAASYLDAENSGLRSSASIVGIDEGQGSTHHHGANDMLETHDRKPVTGEMLESRKDDFEKEKMDGDSFNVRGVSLFLHSPESMESEEIVQIPLHNENEAEDSDLEVSDNAAEEGVDVPLTDSPLIGAPFRLMSFVARYVSGADLVDKSSVKLLR